MASGWLEEQERLSLYVEIRALKNRWTKCISVAGDFVEECQNMVYIFVVVNCVRL